jgi:hypothetical protein
MTSPYRAMCAELLLFSEEAGEICMNESLWPKSDPTCTLQQRARALLDQSEPEGPNPVVDYSRVPEIATEAQIRSAAQYLVKKQNCDGDLIPAIEYAIARWGHPTPQPVAKRPTVMEIIELHTWMEDEWRANNDGEDLPMVDYARAVLAKWGNQ